MKIDEYLAGLGEPFETFLKQDSGNKGYSFLDSGGGDMGQGAEPGADTACRCAGGAKDKEDRQRSIGEFCDQWGEAIKKAK